MPVALRKMKRSRRAATPPDRFACAWSPVDPGAGFISTQEQVEGFRDAIDGTKKYELGSPSNRPVSRRLREKDFKRNGRLNKVDLLYFSGHGTVDGLPLDELDGTSYAFVDIDEIYRWGERNGLKWAVLDACDTLNTGAPPSVAATIERWRSVFHGLHGLLGFATPILSWPGRAQRFAEMLNEGETFLDAWKMACEETEGPIDESETYLWACLRVSDEDTAQDRWPDSQTAVVVGPPVELELVIRAS